MRVGPGACLRRRRLAGASPSASLLLASLVSASVVHPFADATGTLKGGRAQRLAFMAPLAPMWRHHATLSARPGGFLGRNFRPSPRGPTMTATEAQQGILPFLREAGINFVEKDAPRLRFAPSPTGSLHVGGARTALYNYLAAQKFKGKFVVRIEDTDLARSTKESEDSMVADLRWLGLDWDEGPYVDGPGAPYRQSERGDVYVAIAKRLVEMGYAYPCFCTAEELEEKRKKAEENGSPVAYDGTWRDADPAEVQRRIDAGEPYTYRFKVPKGKVVSIDDLVRGTVRWDVEATLGDFILLRSTGVPVYNFCVAVDDALMGVTTVARAEEHLTNTVRQVLVLEALGFPIPQYAHCSLILGEDRSKLSKRHGATSCSQFREQGYLPEAMINYLALLGWNDGTDKDVYTKEELIEAFDLSRVTPSPAMFDITKLKWLNGQHLRAMPLERFERMVGDVLVTHKVLAEPSEAFTKHTAAMVQEKCDLVNDAVSITKAVLDFQFETVAPTEEAEWILGDDYATFCQAVAQSFKAGEMPLDKVNEANFGKFFKDWVNQIGKVTDRKGKRLFMPLRLAVTGNLAGPDIGDQIKQLLLAGDAKMGDVAVVGVEERMERLTKWIDENQAVLAKSQKKYSPTGSDAISDDKVGMAVMDVVNKLAPLQQRTVLALAQQLLETHPPQGGAVDASAKKGLSKPQAKNLDRSGNVEPITRLDLRVGQIVSCEKHPDADSLYVEQIDVGDPEGPRTVISGLAKFIPLEEMQGKKVAVVCNLKPVKMRGIESFGMVLCGSDAEHTRVEILEPPADCEPGERLALESFGLLEPTEEDKVLKSKSQQKVWGIVAPDLKTDGEGRATYRGQLFSTTKGPLRCPSLTGSTIG